MIVSGIFPFHLFDIINTDPLGIRLMYLFNNLPESTIVHLDESSDVVVVIKSYTLQPFYLLVSFLSIMPQVTHPRLILRENSCIHQSRSMVTSLLRLVRMSAIRGDRIFPES